MGSTTKTLSVPAHPPIPAALRPVEVGALEEAHSLMRAFLCLHEPLFSHSFITASRFLWASWLYFPWLEKKKQQKKPGRLTVYLPPPHQHLALIIEGWEHMPGLLGLLLDG